MKVSLPQFALLAAALLCSAPSFAKAPTYTLDGKGFDVSYTGSKDALSLSSDGTSIVFNDLAAGSLLFSSGSAKESSSFTLSLDSGYTFSSLAFSASGFYAGAFSTVSAALTSSVASSGASKLSDTQKLSKNSLIGLSSWSLNSVYDLSSTSFAAASSLTLNSSLKLKASGLASGISADSYSVKVATSAVQITPSVPTVPAVPEPGEWAMMLAGLGMIGTIMMRRTQRS